MPLDAICLSGVVRELRETALGLRIEKVQQPARDQVVLALRGNQKLLLCAGASQARIHFTHVQRENPAAPPMFCMLLRKHLQGGRLTGIDQPGLERAVVLTVDITDELGERGQRRLVLECMGRYSNLILLDGQERIIDCLRRVDMEMSEKRQVLPGLFYHLPPAQEKADPLQTDRETFRRLLSAAPPDREGSAFLLDNFFGLSPLVCREIASAGALEDAFFAWQEAITAERFTPYMLVRDGKPSDYSYLPVRQYGRRGLLEDLLPYIRSDPDLGPEALMERVAEAAAQDGKLYQAFPSFTILTAAGRPELVGDRLRWTLADLAEAMKAMPEGGTALGAGREETLELLLPMLLDSFVDRDAGAASFDGEAFRALLEFCAACPAPEDGESPYTRTQEGRQLLLPAELGTLEWEFILYPTAFGGKCSFVGYPREDGGAGSCFRLGDGVSMTAACRNKEAAWTFVRETFLPRYPTGTYFGSAYPINRADFDRMMAQAAAPELDENGQPAGAPSSFLILPDDSLTIPGRKPTREELEQFTALYDAVDQVYDPDEKLLSIVREGAGAYFAGDKSLADTVRLIQNRASLYLSENQ